MSIESVKARISQCAAEAKHIQQRPKKLFQTILQEKLGGSMVEVGESATLEPISNSASMNALNDTASGDALSQLLQMYQGGGTSKAPNTLSSALGTSKTGGTSAIYNDYNGFPYMPPAIPGIEKAMPYMEYVQEASQKYGMPSNLILGIMKAESDFNNSCVSSAGAKGLMQLMPETAAEVGVSDEFDPRQNILGSVEYITKLVNRYNGDVKLALAAYNTGPGKIARRGVLSSDSPEYLTVPQSIRDYADRVLRYAGYQV